MTTRTQHSRLGIASVLLGVALWAYFALLVMLFLRTDAFQKISWIWDKPARPGQVTGGFEGLFEMLLVLLFLFLVVPAAGHFTGLALAFIGCIQQKRKRMFAVIGFPINGLYFILGVMIFLGSGARQG